MFCCFASIILHWLLFTGTTLISLSFSLLQRQHPFFITLSFSVSLLPLTNMAPRCLKLPRYLLFSDFPTFSTTTNLFFSYWLSASRQFLKNFWHGTLRSPPIPLGNATPFPSPSSKYNTIFALHTIFTTLISLDFIFEVCINRGYVCLGVWHQDIHWLKHPILPPWVNLLASKTIPYPLLGKSSLLLLPHVTLSAVNTRSSPLSILVHIFPEGCPSFNIYAHITRSPCSISVLVISEYLSEYLIGISVNRLYGLMAKDGGCLC